MGNRPSLWLLFSSFCILIDASRFAHELNTGGPDIDQGPGGGGMFSSAHQVHPACHTERTPTAPSPNWPMMVADATSCWICGTFQCGVAPLCYLTSHNRLPGPSCLGHQWTNLHYLWISSGHSNRKVQVFMLSVEAC